MSKSAIVVGAGILGIATARALAVRGYAVKVFERHEQCVGASIRNFGMVWPIGQPGGMLYERAMYSREIWRESCVQAGIWFNPCGSLLNVYEEDELAVVEEFVAMNKGYREATLLTAEETLQKSSVVNATGLKGALWSPAEMIIDPREAISRLPVYLTARYGVAFYFGRTIHHIAYPAVYSGDEVHKADLIFVCSGTDFETLYPELLRKCEITKCKLQMMRTVPQPTDYIIGPALCGGLTLTHYASFVGCPSLGKLQNRILQEMPEYVKWGIHVLISQNGLGEITIGDSHEYGLAPDPFDRQDINRLILRYLDRFAKIRQPKIAQTWHGLYAFKKGESDCVLSPESGVTILNGLGGAGMTLSFGLADEIISKAL